MIVSLSGKYTEMASMASAKEFMAKRCPRLPDRTENGKIIQDKKSYPGSTATVVCMAPYRRLPRGVKQKLVCLENGKWDDGVPNCKECSSSPCLNGGTCVWHANGYTCNCRPGYAGMRCETAHIYCEWTWQEYRGVNWFDPNNTYLKGNATYAFEHESDQPCPLVDENVECKNVNIWNQITVDIDQDMNTVTVTVKPRSSDFGPNTRVALVLPAVVTGFSQTFSTFPGQISVAHSESGVTMTFPGVNKEDSEKIATFAIEHLPSAHIYCEWTWQELRGVNWFDPNNRYLYPEYAFQYESDQPRPLVDENVECKNVNQLNQITVDIDQDMNTVTVTVKPRSSYIGPNTRVALKVPVVVTGFRQTTSTFSGQITAAHTEREVSMILPRVDKTDGEKIAIFAIDHDLCCQPRLSAVSDTTQLITTGLSTVEPTTTDEVLTSNEINTVSDTTQLITTELSTVEPTTTDQALTTDEMNTVTRPGYQLNGYGNNSCVFGWAKEVYPPQFKCVCYYSTGKCMSH